MANIIGTDIAENIDGTDNDDTIDGKGGDDNIEGNDGNDTIYGGDGRDIINGGPGNDTVYAGLGNDVIYAGATDLVYGEAGDDLIISQSFSEGDPDASIYAGEGDDEVRFQTNGFGGLVDLGSGSDELRLGMEMQDVTVTLGTGSDVVLISGLSAAFGGSATITDFEAGDGGDALDLDSMVQYDLQEYDGFANPFGTGHFELVADGAGSAILFHNHPDYGANFTLYFPNVAVGDFTAFNLSGFDPSGVTTLGPPIIGTPDPDTLEGTELGEEIDGRASDDVINGNGGNDTLIGGAGSDTLNGGEGDDLFLFDFSYYEYHDPLLDAAINGGNGTDTVRAIASTQGYDITWYRPGDNLKTSSIERFELSGNLGIEGNVAQIGALEFLSAPNLRLTDGAHFVPGGGFEITQLSMFNGGSSADFSGPGIYVLNIVTGDGNDNIIGPDQAIANPSPSQQSGVMVAIDVRGGDDIVVAGDFATRIYSTGGNNHFTGSGFADSFYISGNGNNTIIAGDGDDDISIAGVGISNVSGGDGDDVIEIESFDADDVISGGAGRDTLSLYNAFGTLDLTGFTFPSDIEVLYLPGVAVLTVEQIATLDSVIANVLTIADGGAVTLIRAPVHVNLSDEGNWIDLSGEGQLRVSVRGGDGDDIVYGGQEDNYLLGGGGNDELHSNSFEDALYGDEGNDTLFAGAGDDSLWGGANDDRFVAGPGNDFINGGTHIDTAIFSGNRDSYTITQTQTGVFQIVGPEGTNNLEEVEYAEFDDQIVRLMPGEGVSVNFETADPSVYQSAMDNILDFDGNYLGGGGSWLRIGSADIDGDGDIDQILVNDAIGRFATVGGSPDGLFYFDDHGWAGETRVVGIYIDPEVVADPSKAGGPFDSQLRFQNDLFIENINRVLGADDYDGDGLQEVYFALTDGTAYLHAYMHADGNIQYANYQSEAQVIEFLEANGFGAETYGGWFA